MQPTVAQKRYSPMKYTKSIKQRNKSPSNRKNQSPLKPHKYCCHHANSLYMGPSDCFKKCGQGILLLDSGVCIVCNHLHDNMINHNVIFRNGAIISLLIDDYYHQKRKDICLRWREFILQIVEIDDQIEGKGYLVDYKQKKIFKLNFHRNQITKKIRVIQNQIIQQVFGSNNNLSAIINSNHNDALNIKLKLAPEISMVGENNTYIIGFCDNGEAKRNRILVNGLAFSLSVQKDRPELFDVTIKDRGLYQNSKLQGFGQKHFPNGNYYIGQFKNNQFHGEGVLVYPKQQKWTLGNYYQGKLVQVISSSVGQDNNKSSSPKKPQSPTKYHKQSIYEVISKLHQKQRTYIQNKTVISPNYNHLINILTKVHNEDPYEYQSIYHTWEHNRKIENLQKIQDDYVNKKFEHETQQVILQTILQKNLKNGPIRIQEDGGQLESGQVFIKSKSKSKSTPTNKENTKHRQMEQPEDRLISRQSSRSRSKSRQLQPIITTMIQQPKLGTHSRQKTAIQSSLSPNFLKYLSPQRRLKYQDYQLQTRVKQYGDKLAYQHSNSNYSNNNQLLQRASLGLLRPQQRSNGRQTQSKWRNYVQQRDGGLYERSSRSKDRIVHQTNFKYWDDEDDRDEYYYTRYNNSTNSPYRNLSPQRRI